MLAMLPEGVTAYFELPIDADPAPLAGGRGRAKVRTGGLTPEAFPAPADLARFLYRCAKARVPFKATAGLHHPIRSMQRCTYEPDSPDRADARVRERVPGGGAAVARREARATRLRRWKRNRRASFTSTTGRGVARSSSHSVDQLREARESSRSASALALLRSRLAICSGSGGYDGFRSSLPYGVFRRGAETAIGVAIGDRILDLRRGVAAGLFDALPPETRRACAGETLNALMALTPPTGTHCARALGTCRSSDAEPYLVPMRDAEMLLPVDIGDYTDFYASIYHATNVGSCSARTIRCCRTTSTCRSGITGALFDRGERHADPTSGKRADPGVVPRSVRRARWTTNSKSGSSSAAGNALGEPIPIEPPRSTCSASAW